ncbi:hypothetical protein CPC08DRAFT_768859 [Agrocybe pediades]|nr:hypothetical protein CPC08DRAFT_768859 [Agrocybe pediades]
MSASLKLLSGNPAHQFGGTYIKVKRGTLYKKVITELEDEDWRYITKKVMRTRANKISLPQRPWIRRVLMTGHLRRAG